MVGETDDETLQNNVQTDHEGCRLRRQVPVGDREKLAADIQDKVLENFPDKNGCKQPPPNQSSLLYPHFVIPAIPSLCHPRLGRGSPLKKGRFMSLRGTNGPEAIYSG